MEPKSRKRRRAQFLKENSIESIKTEPDKKGGEKVLEFQDQKRSRGRPPNLQK